MKHIAIFASGSGTNAENIARLFHQGNRIRVAVVLSNKKNAGVHARMEALGVPTVYHPNSVWDNEPETILKALEPYDVDLVVLAGFMRTIRPAIIEAYKGRMINIHPSLLPAYGGKGMYGHHVHEAVIAAGEKQSGVSVHYVTPEIDGGEILMQQAVDILPDDTAETLEAKIHPVEYSLYPRAIVAALNRIDSENMSDKSEVCSVVENKQEKSVDAAWAEVLHLKYSEQEAEDAKRRLQVSSTRDEAKTKTVLPPPPAVPITEQPAAKSAGQPKSHLVAAIVVTILCCTLPGIIAIVYSASVSSRIAAGDMQGAEKASRRAEGWIIASFVLGLLSATLYLPLTIIQNMF